MRSAWSASNAFSACSIRVMTSPMSRMREAMRSGWNVSKSPSFSPIDANMIGRSVTVTTDRAAPPRASPSSLVSTTASKPTPASNSWAVRTASWPIIASTTSRVLSGRAASRTSRSCRIRSASTASRPAVSTMTTSWTLASANSRAARVTATGSPTPLPGSGAKTTTPACSPTTFSWSTALGRCRSAATSRGVCPSLRRCRASLPASVVLPAPCRPASRMTVGPDLANVSRAVSPPRTGDELLVDDLDDLLRRVQRAGHLRRERPLLDRRGELADDRQGDVGLEQRRADLADGGVDVRLGQPALAAKALEGRGESVGEGGEHGRQRNRRDGSRESREGRQDGHAQRRLPIRRQWAP